MKRKSSFGPAREEWVIIGEETKTRSGKKEEGKKLSSAGTPPGLG
jgi:hypothetical protein